MPFYAQITTTTNILVKIYCLKMIVSLFFVGNINFKERVTLLVIPECRWSREIMKWIVSSKRGERAQYHG